MSRAIRSAEALGVTFHRHTREEARHLVEEVKSVYLESYREAIASGHSFDSPRQFMARYDAYSSQTQFDLIMAYQADQPIAQAWGWPLSKESAWWNGLRAAPEPDFTQEDGQRTFALSEIMVVAGWTGKGIAHALHDTLLAERREERATLLVEPGNLRARRAYQRWGWRKVAQLLPNWADAPLFDVFLRSLRDG